MFDVQRSIVTTVPNSKPCETKNITHQANDKKRTKKPNELSERLCSDKQLDRRTSHTIIATGLINKRAEIEKRRTIPSSVDIKHTKKQQNYTRDSQIPAPQLTHRFSDSIFKFKENYELHWWWLLIVWNHSIQYGRRLHKCRADYFVWDIIIII